MALYPTTVIDNATLAQEPNFINPSSLIVTPIDMTTAQMVQIDVQQMSNTQYFSLRAWVSQFQNGIAFAPGNYPVLTWAGALIVIYVPGQTPSANTFAIQVPVGTYWFNILNLTNEHNVFSFLITTLA